MLKARLKDGFHPFTAEGQTDQIKSRLEAGRIGHIIVEVKMAADFWMSGLPVQIQIFGRAQLGQNLIPGHGFPP